MLRYHLARVMRPSLLFILAVIGFMTVFFYRRGGIEGGIFFSYAKVLQYWSIMTPLLLIGVVASTSTIWTIYAADDPLILARPRTHRAVCNAFARILALMVPIILVGVGASIFLSTRVPDAATKTIHIVAFKDPVTIGTVWLVFIVGPFAGSAALLALSELVGTIFRSNTLRVVLVGVITSMDASNQINSPLLSPSGTALNIVQSTCCTAPVKVEHVLGTYWTQHAAWGQYVFNNDFRAFDGPFTVDPTVGLVTARLALLIMAVMLTIGLGVLQIQRLQDSLDQPR